MFSIPYLITILYPQKKEEDLQAMVDKFFADSVLYPDYNSYSWVEVKKEDLNEEEVQFSLIKTLYQSQFSYEGIIDTIMGSLEEWTDGEIIFPDFDVDTQAFLERYYGFFGWTNFRNISFERKTFLLGGRFLILAAIWDVPIYNNVQLHFGQYAYVRGMQEDCEVFSGMISRNESELGEEGKIKKTISQWVEMFKEFEEGSLEDKVNYFMSEKMEVSRLDEKTKSILYKILTLYWGIKTGFIYREIENSVPAGFERKEKRDNKSIDDNYLEILYQANPEQFEQWLGTCGETAYWMYLNKKSENFIKALIYVLFEKIDLDNDEHVVMILEFFSLLQDFGLVGAEDVLFFDESEGKFIWDEKLMFGLRPDLEAPKKKSNDSEEYYLV